MPRKRPPPSTASFNPMLVEPFNVLRLCHSSSMFHSANCVAPGWFLSKGIQKNSFDMQRLLLRSSFNRCERCKSRWYCSAACQRSDWSQHKRNSKMMIRPRRHMSDDLTPFWNADVPCTMLESLNVHFDQSGQFEDFVIPTNLGKPLFVARLHVELVPLVRALSSSKLLGFEMFRDGCRI
ncbi:hypothetical protein BJ741DRAFT_21247 [Chytriomyces cf. hyalinus JEL632]|nr:hypothetical protein BJ741DRAFT_21247 [Chytriomyces cf. hyalinus JEL632]